MLTKINLALSALADRLFVGSHSVTQEAISKASPEEQRAIAESFRLAKPVYFYAFEKKDKRKETDESSDSDYY